MFQPHFPLAFLVGLSLGSANPSDQNIARDVDPAIPKYVPPALNRDITEWFAIGDSFSAGISADVPSDLLNGACSRFKMSYPNQMNKDERFPGNTSSRTFVFASCSDPNTDADNQIDLLLPNQKANFPKMENPQIGTVSLSWDDLGFVEVRYSL